MKLTDEYISAIHNEIAIDKSLYSLMNVKAEEYGFLPRPSKWLNNYKDHKQLIKIIGLFSLILWLAGAGILFFLKDFIKYFKYSMSFSKVVSEIKSEQEYGLGFSQRAIEIIDNTIGKKLKCWISFPWVDVKAWPAEVKVISIFSMLTTQDLLKALILSILSTYRLVFNSETIGWGLQSYTAYPWFISRLALQKINSGDFYTAEHYDRWAVMADMLVCELKKRNASSSLTLVQHGILKSLAEAVPGRDFLIDLKYRLNSVSNLYIYDDDSLNIFRNYILVTGRDSKPVNIQYFKPTIVLSNINSGDKASILFVGHPLCEDLHIALYKKLKIKHNISGYYKPHPAASGAKISVDTDWNIINDKAFFPDVDLLISYPSTLVSEYSNSGVPAVVHPMSIPSEQTELLLIDVETKMKQILKK